MARAASVSKAYTVAVVFIAIGAVWTLVSGGEGIQPIPMGLIVAGGLGLIAAAITSIRQKGRDAKAAEADG